MLTECRCGGFRGPAPRAGCRGGGAERRHGQLRVIVRPGYAGEQCVTVEPLRWRELHERNAVHPGFGWLDADKGAPVFAKNSLTQQPDLPSLREDDLHGAGGGKRDGRFNRCAATIPAEHLTPGLPHSTEHVAPHGESGGVGISGGIDARSTDRVLHQQIFRGAARIDVMGPIQETAHMPAGNGAQVCLDFEQGFLHDDEGGGAGAGHHGGQQVIAVVLRHPWNRPSGRDGARFDTLISHDDRRCPEVAGHPPRRVTRECADR